MSTLKPKKKIGVLGGMGPAVTAAFFSDLIALCQSVYQAEQDTDFPEVILYNAPLDGFTETGFADMEAVKNQLVNDVKKIESWGADFIVIPCNTVHYFISDMRAAVSIPIISIVDVTIAELTDKGLKKVGIVSSLSTRNLKLYENACLARGLEVVVANDGEQKNLDEAILAVMAGKQGAIEASSMKNTIERMTSDGAEGVVLGCTELPLAVKKEDISTPLFDTIQLLARAAVGASYGSQK